MRHLLAATVLLSAASSHSACPLPAAWSLSATVTSICVEPGGSVFVAGGGQVSKLSSGGVPQWTVRIQGTVFDDSGGAYAVAALSGGVVVVGTVDRPDGVPVGFLQRYDSGGGNLWSVSYTGGLLTAAAVTPCGAIVAAGLEPRQGGLLLLKYDASGALLWARTSDGGGGIDAAGGSAVAVDGGGNIVTAGFVYADGINANLLVEKYDGAGSLVWRRTWDSGSNRNDEAWGVAVDQFGSVFAAGEQGRATGATGADAVLLAWDSNGTPLWTKAFSGLGVSDDEGRAVTVNACGIVSVAALENDGAGSVWRVRSFTRAGTPQCNLTELDVPSSTTYGAHAVAWDPAGGLVIAGGPDPLGPVTAGPGRVRRYPLADCGPLPVTAMTLSISRVPASPVNGQPVTYRILATNTGAATLSALVLTDTLPPGVLILGSSAPTGFVLSGPNDAAGGTAYVFSGGPPVAPGQTLTFTLTGRVGESCAVLPIPITVLATAAATCSLSATAATLSGSSAGPPPVAVIADLVRSPSSPAAGVPVSFRLVISNTGMATVNAITVVATLPAVLVSPLTAEPPGFPLPVVAAGGSGATRFIWSASGMTWGPGQAMTFTVTGWAGPVCAITPAPAGAVATATGPCTSTSAPPVSTSWTAVPPVGGMVVAHTLAPSAPNPDMPLTFRITVINDGVATLTGLTICDTVPATARISSSDQPVPFGPPAILAAGASGSLFVWSDPAVTIPPGLSLTFTLTGFAGRVCAAAPVQAVTQALSQSGCAPVASGASGAVWVAAPAPEAVVVAASVSPVAPVTGDTAVWRIVATNTGATTLSGLVVTGTLPALLANPATQEPSGWTASGPAVVPGGAWFAWTGVPPLPPGTALTFTITGGIGETCTAGPATSAMAAEAAGLCGAVASVIAGPSFASGPATPAVTTAVTIAASGPPGATDVWRILVTNTGAATLTTLTLVDTIPSAVGTLTSGEPAVFPAAAATAVAGGTRLVWTAAGLAFAPGTAFTFTVTGITAPSCAVTQVETRVAIVAATACATTSAIGGPASFTSTPVVPVLALEHGWTNAASGTPSPVPRNGSSARWTLILRNTGTDGATAVEIVDTLPTHVARITGVTAPSGWTVDVTRSGTGGTLVATAITASIAPGVSAMIYIDTEIAGPFAGAFDVTALATASSLRACDSSRVSTGVRTAGFRVDPLDPGRVRITAGPHGWVNPGLGEVATIQVRPASPGLLAIRIYDEQGRLVRDLSRDAAGSATEVATWDGRDGAGRALAPGLYPVLIDGPGVRVRDTLSVMR